MLASRQYIKALEMIGQANNVLALTHINPDGDAWGSLSAASIILFNIGKNYTIFCQNAETVKFKFLSNLDKVLTKQEELDLSKYDLFITLDCGVFARCGLNVSDLPSKAKILEIDHHQAQAPVGFSLRDDQAAATCEVLFDFIRVNKLKLSADLATALMSGLITDTGHFVYASTTKEVFNMAADLKVAGADANLINRQSDRKNLDSLKLWGLAMSRLKIRTDGIAYTYLSIEDFRAYPNGGDLDNLAGFLSGLESSRALLFLKQFENGVVRGSWRGISADFDANKIAHIWGGGGHIKAAGFTLIGDLQINQEEIFINDLRVDSVGAKISIDDLCQF